MNGVVTAIDDKSITVCGNNSAYPAGGVTLRFAFSDALTRGEVTKGLLPGERFLPTDVQIGDKVHLGGSRTKGILTCTHISIVRRPGGQVPKAPGEEEIRFGFRHSEYMNAHQALEEKGTPLPAKFVLPSLPANYRRPETGPNPLPPPLTKEIPERPAPLPEPPLPPPKNR
jgi:hypothetical protein